MNMISVVVFAAEQEIGGGFSGIGPLGLVGLPSIPSIDDLMALFNKVISNIVGIMTISAGIWFIFQFIIGAFGWLTAGGDKAAIENAQKRIMNAVIGIMVVVAAVFLIELLGSLMGLEILRPGKFIIGIWQ